MAFEYAERQRSIEIICEEWTEDVERFEAAAGDLLDGLGYERAFPQPSRAALEHGLRIRCAFIQGAGKRPTERL